MTGDRLLPAGAHVDHEGVWVQRLREPRWKRPVPALFLDRDGVVVVEVNYLHRIEDARLERGAAEAIGSANRLGVPVVFVTNQAGIGYGYFGWPEFAAVQEKILTDLAAAGAFVDAVLACPHHAKGQPPYDHPDHPARKPNPGMLTRAASLLDLDLARSWMVGDRASDLEAAKRAGLEGAVHVLTGHGSREGEEAKCQAVAGPRFRVRTAPSIAEAIPLLPVLET
ncbi:MAG: HAD-IIIA family hydrolase [Magnetospirillum sp. WYHS-4]